MKQRLVVWGEIGTDRKALIAISFDGGERKVFIHAIPKEEVTKELQNTLFQVWSKGGNCELPSNAFFWEINEADQKALPPEIKVDKPSIVNNAYEDWVRKLVSLKYVEGFNEEILQLKAKAGLKGAKNEQAWKQAKSLWSKIVSAIKAKNVTKEQADLLKINIDDIFEALKGQKRISREQDFEFSLTNYKALNKKIDTCNEKLVYPKEWNKIFNTLKDIQAEIKELPLIHKHNRELWNRINVTFKDLRSYKQVEYDNRQKDRVKNLQTVMHKLKRTIKEDEENHQMQYDKIMHYTRGRLPEEEVQDRLQYIKDKIISKEKKIKDIAKTIASLQKKEKKKEAKEEEKTEKPEGKKPAKSEVKEEKQ